MDTSPGGARTLFSGGGRLNAYNNIGTAPVPILGAAGSRLSITFHNPGTVDIFVAPTVVQTGGSDVPLVPSPAALGGCIRIYANGGTFLVTGAAAQRAWQAFSATGANNPLTAMDSNT